MAQSITCTGFSIFPQPLASWTLAVVAADGVAAAVVAAAVLRGALVDICQEKAQANHWRVGTDHSTWRSEDSPVWLMWKNEKVSETNSSGLWSNPRSSHAQQCCWVPPPNQVRFRLGITKHLLIEGIAKHWNSVPREVVESPYRDLKDRYHRIITVGKCLWDPPAQPLVDVALGDVV